MSRPVADTPSRRIDDDCPQVNGKLVKIELDDEEPRVRPQKTPPLKDAKDYLNYMTPVDNGLSIIQFRKYIVTNAKFLTSADHKDIGKIFLSANYESKMKENSDGIYINLDTISDREFLRTVYACVKYKISRNHK